MCSAFTSSNRAHERVHACQPDPLLSLYLPMRSRLGSPSWCTCCSLLHLLQPSKSAAPGRQVTKRRARSLIADLHANMVGHQIASDHGHCIDQLLYHFSMHNNLSWVVGSNFVSPQNGAHVGLFYQDRARFSSTLDA